MHGIIYIYIHVSKSNISWQSICNLPYIDSESLEMFEIYLFWNKVKRSNRCVKNLKKPMKTKQRKSNLCLWLTLTHAHTNLHTNKPNKNSQRFASMRTNKEPSEASSEQKAARSGERRAKRGFSFHTWHFHSDGGDMFFFLLFHSSVIHNLPMNSYGVILEDKHAAEFSYGSYSDECPQWFSTSTSFVKVIDM